jgi:hypothetical protein
LPALIQELEKLCGPAICTGLPLAEEIDLVDDELARPRIAESNAEKSIVRRRGELYGGVNLAGGARHASGVAQLGPGLSVVGAGHRHGPNLGLGIAAHHAIEIDAVDFERRRAAGKFHLHPDVLTVEVDAGYPIAIEQIFALVLGEHAVGAAGGGDPARQGSLFDAVGNNCAVRLKS